MFLYAKDNTEAQTSPVTPIIHAVQSKKEMKKCGRETS